jgi:hypothetical protein
MDQLPKMGCSKGTGFEATLMNVRLGLSVVIAPMAGSYGDICLCTWYVCKVKTEVRRIRHKLRVKLKT